ncbi:MAG: hypothetical protein DRO08_02290 [Thermoprotei archaeon]|nr:MAG: hypothetical protein DRO08_02290 [Thermoprotei archaeon]
MALRIKVKICYRSKCVETLALLNTGFETPVPMISLPIELAEKLGLQVGTPIEFEGPGLTRGSSYHGGEVTITVSSEKETREIKAQALITPGEEEAIMSDKCIEALGIVIDLKSRKWWFT